MSRDQAPTASRSASGFLSGGAARLLAGAVVISFSPVYVRASDVPTSLASFYRVFFGAVVLIALVLTRPQWRAGLLRARPSFHAAMLGTALLFALDLQCWHACIRYVGPGLATLLGAFQVFFMALAGVFLLGERPSVRFWLAIPAALAGIWLVLGIDLSELSGDAGIGVALGIATGAAYAGYILCLRRALAMKHAPSNVPTMTLISLYTALVVGLPLLLTGSSFALPSTADWLLMAGYGVGSQALGWLIITSGLPLVPASLAGLLILLQPALAFVWDVWFFDRPAPLTAVAGLILALAAIHQGSRSAR